MRRFRPTAFTLIELLIVVAIIAILAAIAVPNFIEAQVRSKIAKVKADMRTIATALETYNVDTNSYPPVYPAWWDHPYPNVSYTRRWNYILWEPTDRSGCMLTTPIAYLGGPPPLDPFAVGENSGDRVGSFWYTCFSGALEDIDRQPGPGDGTLIMDPDMTAPTPVMFNGEGGEMRQCNWLLSCVGPKLDTRCNRFRWLNEPLATIYGWHSLTKGTWALYDATNGTVSNGIIVRGDAGQF